MKRIFIISLFLLLVFNVHAQIAAYKIMRGEKELITRPRFGLDLGIPINLIGPWAIIPNTGAFTETGLFVTNNGFIFDEGKNRYHHRVIGVSVPLRAGKIIKEKFYLGTGVNFNFNLHYKQRTYDYGTKNNEQVIVNDYFSEQVNVFYPSIDFSAGISLHGIGRISLRAKLYTGSLFNQAYTETVDGLEVKPYEDLTVTQSFKIMISYNSGL